MPGEGNNRVMCPHFWIGHDDTLDVLKEKLGDWMRESNSEIFFFKCYKLKNALRLDDFCTQHKKWTPAH